VSIHTGPHVRSSGRLVDLREQ